MLSMRDAKLLRRLDLPVEHKAYLSNLWYENPQHRSMLDVLITWLLRALVPAMCAVLIGALWYPEIEWGPFLRFASFVVWIFIVCAPLLIGFEFFGFIMMARNQEKLHAFITKRGGVGGG